MAESKCVTTTATDGQGVKTITTACTDHVAWWAQNWGWIFLATIAVIAVGYVVAQWWDRREARRRAAEVVAAHEKSEAAYRELRDEQRAWNAERLTRQTGRQP